MKVIPLFSGSNGNSTLIKSEKGNILIDVGVSVSRLLSGLKQHGESLESLDGILLTHTHKDHVAGVQRLVFQKPHLKVFGGKDSEKYALCTGFEEVKAGDRIQIADMNISIFPVPHDVPCFGFSIETDSEKIGYATDIGELTKQTLDHLLGSKTVMIESNYDESLLAKGEYPIYLKRRISSVHGHLSNTQCASACKSLIESGTKNFILAHLSQQNNTPEIAYQETKTALESCGAKLFCDYTLHVAKRFGLDEEIN